MKHLSIIILICIQSVFFNLSLNAQNNAISDLINKQEYSKAIELLTANTPIEKMDNEALVNLGYCYIMTKDFNNAEIVFAELSVRKRSPKENTLYYAELLLINGKYDDAKIYFNNYLEKDPTNAIVKVKIQSCDSLKHWQTIQNNIRVANGGSMNTSDHELNPCIYNNRLIFISNRPESASGLPVSSVRQVMKLYEENQSSGSLFRNNMFENYSCGASAYCKTTNLSAFTVKKITQNIYDITMGQSEILLLKSNNSESSAIEKFSWEGMPHQVNIAHPAFGKKGNRLYFSSDMTGGFGGMDLWYSDFSNNQWNPPVNLGSKINTPFDELFPVVWGDTMLLFSSAGHPGYGNFDIFKCSINGNAFSIPINAKAPFNSIGDDFSPVAINASTGYLSSNRSSLSKGGYDIISWSIPVVEEPVVEKPKPSHIFNPEDLPLYSVLFETNSSEIHVRFHPMLKTLADTMKKHPDLVVQINGYTDITGGDAMNVQLSSHRAEALKNFLVAEGVHSEQIVSQGLGKSNSQELKGLLYHVQIGSTLSGNDTEWFKKLIGDNYPVFMFQYKGRFSYVAGAYSTKAEAIATLSNLEKLNISCFIIASYMGERLPDYYLSINRKADLTYITSGKPTTSLNINKDINELENAKAGDLITLSDIQFYPGESIPLPGAEEIMKQLADIMLSHPSLEVEIRGHICCATTDEENLSDRRAKVVFDYLIESGVESKRLSWKGFGHTQPLTDESTPEKQQQNRRVEIYVLKN
jgi:outer membrane protein OmpA-like peptidoglycan-associated protein